MSWIQQRTHRAMRHLKSGGSQLVQAKADQRQETYRARLNRELELYTRRINHPPLIHNGKKAR